MTTFERFVILFLIVIFTSMSYAVLKTAKETQESIKDIKDIREQQLTLPEKCRKFYNDGTDRWVNCIGVEYK